MKDHRKEYRTLSYETRAYSIRIECAQNEYMSKYVEYENGRIIVNNDVDNNVK